MRKLAMALTLISVSIAGCGSSETTSPTATPEPESRYTAYQVQRIIDAEARERNWRGRCAWPTYEGDGIWDCIWFVFDENTGQVHPTR